MLAKPAGMTAPLRPVSPKPVAAVYDRRTPEAFAAKPPPRPTR